jgi:zinc protease
MQLMMLEIEMLRNQLVEPEELDLVRNYMLGSMLGSLENAFSHADKFKNLYFSKLDYGYYDRYINTVKTITPEEVMALANCYLQLEHFTSVVVGKK